MSRAIVAHGTALLQRCSARDRRAAVVTSRAHILAPSPTMIWVSAMRYLGAVVAGMVGAAAGWFVTSALAVWIAGLYGMSDFEGERGMFAALFIGPIGGLVCMILAIWGALRIGKGRAPLGATLGRAGLVVAGIAAIVGAGVGLRVLTPGTYLHGAPPPL